MTTATASHDTAELAATQPAVSLRVVACAARTHRGARRPVNEDAVLVAAPVLAVADGVGGQRAGEDASALALDVLRREVRASPADPETELRRALGSANRDVRRAAAANMREGMATTIVIALVGAGTLDDRARGRQPGLPAQRRATASTHGRPLPSSPRWSQTAAWRPTPPATIRCARSSCARSGWRRRYARRSRLSPRAETTCLLLCTDGVTDAVEPEHLERLALAEQDPDRLVERLATVARQAGSGDDIALVAARLG